MDRIPLLQSQKFDSLPNSPARSTPRTPGSARSRKHIHAVLAGVVGLVSLSWMAVAVVSLVLTGGVRSMADPALAFGPEAAVYQACRSAAAGVALPRLDPAQQWRSAKRQDDDGITLVTQLSLERLAAVQAQCRAWPDRLAAVIYVPVVAGFGAASAEVGVLNGTSPAAVARLLARVHDEAELDPAGCALDLELAIEWIPSWSDPAVALYPFNAVRNRALMLARSEAVLLLDVDFLPPAPLARAVRAAPEAYAALMQQLVEGHSAVVLPAFETADRSDSGRGVAAAAAAAGKPHVLAALAAGELLPFQVAQYAKGHTPTNFSRWAASSEQYEIRYEMGFEPYVVAARRHVPFYDERFRGYGRDKIVHLAHMASLGIKFSVHPTAYVVHSPHPKAATFRATKLSGQWDKLYDLYVEVRKEMASPAGFVPVTAFAARCPAHWTQEEYAASHAAAAEEARAAKKQAKAAAKAAEAEKLARWEEGAVDKALGRKAAARR